MRYKPVDWTVFYMGMAAGLMLGAVVGAVFGC